MPIAAEVAAFEGKICGYKYFVPARRAQNGAIVADPKPNASTAPHPTPSGSDLLNQCEFAQGFGHVGLVKVKQVKQA